MSAGPTWILMTRNASDSVQIADIPRVVAAMIVDADTGLVRGINVAATAPEARTLAMTMALTQPAGPLPADTPAAVVCTDGLVCYPGAALPAAPHHWQPDQPIPVPAGTLFLWLDPPDEVPAEFAGKARRYGWPADAKLLPVCLTANRDGPADLDQIAARRLSVAIAAVLNHSDRAPGNTDRTAGTLRLADGGHASYTVQWAGATAGR